MKKWISLLFLMLLCGTTLTQCMPLHTDAIEQTADSDKSKDAKQDKTDGKEFDTTSVKKQLMPVPPFQNYITYQFLLLPQPPITKPTPPPIVTC